MHRVVALALTVLTGFTGLVYEVAWQKFLATLLGSHSEATAAVLGIFLAGLSVGYAVFGRASRTLAMRAAQDGSQARLLAAYGAIELAIGLYAFAFPALFGFGQTISFALPASGVGTGFAIDVVLSALLIGPPAVLMGATIPLLTQALARDLDDATRLHAWVYACNTAGACAGALAAGFVLVPAYGLEGVMWRMGVLNVAAGAAFLALDRMLPARSTSLAAESAAKTPLDLTTFVSVAALCGFGAMALQTVTMRMAGLALGSSPFTFSIVVAVFVLCIALGSLAISLIPRISPRLLLFDLWMIAFLLVILYQSLPHAPYWAHLLRIAFGDDPQLFHLYSLACAAGVAALIGAPVFLSGATLPLLFHHLRDHGADLGRVAGRLYAWNTVGSLAGALLAGYWLLQWLDLHHVYRLATAAFVLAAALATARILGRPPWLVCGASLALMAAVNATLAPWQPAMLSIGLFRMRDPLPSSYLGASTMLRDRTQHGSIRFYDDDPVSSVAVTEFERADGTFIRSIVNNGKSDGSTHHDLPTMALAALLPALFAEKVENGFVIGWGTGITAGQLADLDGVERVVVSEISPAVIEAAPLFDFANNDASRHPAIHFERGDAYRTLSRDETRYDVIVSEPSNPWVAGVEMLYSVEFLEAARARLSPGGVYLQWFHQYETNAASVELVLRTFSSVFPRVSIWYGAGTDLLILGFEEDDIDAATLLARLEDRFARADIARGLARLDAASVPALLTRELVPLGVLHAGGQTGPVHRLLHPILSFEAGRGFFEGRTASLPFYGWGEPARVGEGASMLRVYSEGRGGLADREWLDVLKTACRTLVDQCNTFAAAWIHHAPDSESLARLLEAASDPESPYHGRLVPEQADLLMSFYREGDGVVTRSDAVGAMLRYRDYYQHAAPFEPSGLREIWRRCGDACAEDAWLVDALFEGRIAIARGIADPTRPPEPGGQAAH